MNIVKKLGVLLCAGLMGVLSFAAWGDGLPAGYTQVEYIESTGVQYIDTGYTHKTNTKVVADIYVGTKQRGTWSALFGARNASSTADNAFYFDSRLTSGPVYNRCGSEVKDNTGAHTLTGNRFTITCDGLKATYRKKDATSDTGSITVSGTLSAGFNRMLVFGLNKSSTEDGLAPEGGTLTAMKLYSFKIYDGTTLAMDLAPCVSPNGVAGVYDKVGGTFKVNSGADRFYLPDDPAELLFARGWVENTITNGTSAHYIDTGYTPTKNSQIETRIRPYAKTMGWAVFFGEQSGDNHTYTVAVRYNGGWQGQFCGGASTAIPITDEQDYDVALQAGSLKAKLTTASTWTEQAISGSNAPASNSLYLFCSHNTGNGDSSNGRAWRYQKARFYNFKVSESGTLKCNMLPARDKKSGTIGFYDLVRSQFYATALASNALTAYGDPLSYWPEGTTFTAYSGTLTADDLSGYAMFEKAGLLAVDASAVTSYENLTLSGGVLSFADGAATARTVSGTLTLAGGTRIEVDLTDDAADCITATKVDLSSASRAHPVTISVHESGSTFTTPRVVLSGGLVAADLAKFRIEGSTALMPAIVEGALTVVADPNPIKIAHWTGAEDYDPTKSANWTCTDANGQTVENAVPGWNTAVYIDESCNLSVPEGMVFPYKTLTLAGTVTLSEDCNWSGLDDGGGLAWLAGTTVDANGHALTLRSAVNLTAGTVTSSAAGGSLHVVVPDGMTVTNSGLLLQGSLQFIKEGAGTYIAAMNNTSSPYTGGTVVVEGTAAAPARTTNRYDAWNDAKFYGATKNEAAAITVGSGSIFETGGFIQFFAYYFVLKGGTLQNSGFDMTDDMSSGDNRYGIGSLKLEDNSTLSVQKSLIQYCKAGQNPWSGSVSANSVIDLNGKTLAVNIADGKTWYTRSVVANNGTIRVRGADGNVGDGIWWIANAAFTATDNVTVDVGCQVRLEYDAAVKNLTWHYAEACGLSDVEKKITVSGTFLPEADYFCNIQMEDGSTLDLTTKTGSWSTTSLDTKDGKTYCTSFATDAAVTVDVTGRTDLFALAKSADPYLVKWDTVPATTFTLKGKTGASVVKDETGLRIDVPTVALIGTVPYETVVDALAAATDGQTVKILANAMNLAYARNDDTGRTLTITASFAEGLYAPPDGTTYLLQQSTDGGTNWSDVGSAQAGKVFTAVPMPAAGSSVRYRVKMILP